MPRPLAQHQPSPDQPVPLICTSKKWVLPPRPKPGRKPSADAPAAVKRKAQNRAAQKAYRERRAADSSTLATTPEAADEDTKKKKPAGSAKKKDKPATTTIKKEEGELEFTSLSGLTLVSINEPSMDINIKSESQAAPRFFSMDHPESYDGTNDKKGSSEELSEDKQTILDLRMALDASFRETARLTELVSELRNEIEMLKDLKIAEKTFLRDVEQQQQQQQQQLVKPLKADKCRTCGHRVDSGECVCALKSNPFFGGDDTAGLVKLPKRSDAAGTSTTPKRWFKRDPAMLETDFTLAFATKGSGYRHSNQRSPTSKPNSLSSSWTAASDVSPRTDESPNTSHDDDDDEAMLSVPSRIKEEDEEEGDGETTSAYTTTKKRTIVRSASSSSCKTGGGAAVGCGAGQACCKKKHKPDDAPSKQQQQQQQQQQRQQRQRKVVIDPCGFCSNGTPCLCLEAAGDIVDDEGEGVNDMEFEISA